MNECVDRSKPTTFLCRSTHKIFRALSRSPRHSKTSHALTHILLGAENCTYILVALLAFAHKFLARFPERKKKKGQPSKPPPPLQHRTHQIKKAMSTEMPTAQRPSSPPPSAILTRARLLKQGAPGAPARPPKRDRNSAVSPIVVELPHPKCLFG